jgi:hypothetical protein
MAHRLSTPLRAVAFTLGLRALYSLAAALWTPFLSLDPARVYVNPFTEDLAQRSYSANYLFVGVWQRFDAMAYLHIANSGYDRPELVVFYPLYPLLIRIFSSLADPAIVALAVSTVSAFFLFWGLENLWLLDFPPKSVNRVLLLAGLWPPAFIWFAGYADSLVLALILWSVFFARTGRLKQAGILGLFAGLTKAVGVLVVVPLALLAWRERARNLRYVLLPLLSTILFFGFLRWSGSPTPFEVYPTHYGTVPSAPWSTLWDSLLQARQYIGVLANLTLFLLACLLAVSFRKRPEFLAFTCAVVLFVLIKKSAPTQQQWARYALVLFPAYYSLGRFLEDRALFAGVVLVLALVDMVLLRAFLDWSMVV